MHRVTLTRELHALIDEKCDQFETAWPLPERLRIDSLLKGVPTSALPHLVCELVALECELRAAASDPPSTEEYAARFPAYADELRKALASDRSSSNGDSNASSGDQVTATHPSPDSDGQPAGTSGSSGGQLEIRCPGCGTPTNVAVDTVSTDFTCDACGSHFSLIDQAGGTRAATSLSTLGRFELIERIGVGGFGTVWKARDKALDRTVAIKIPRQRGMSVEEQEKFFREARAAAQLRHPNIVSVHEVGRDGETIYIVSSFVRGVTLSDWLTGQQLTTRIDFQRRRSK